MSRDEFFRELEAIFGTESESVDAEFLLDGHLDSLSTLMVIALADDSFHASLDAQTILNCASVNDLIIAIGLDKFHE
jgi:acyl carrier protein